MTGRYTYLVARPVYVYLRSRGPLDGDEEAMDAAAAMFSQPTLPKDVADVAEVIDYSDDTDAFVDGFVVRLRTNKTLDELTSAWGPHLSKFETWAIHDGKRDVRESDGSLGSVRHALDGVRSGPMPVTQAFLMAYAPDQDERSDQNLVAESVVASWQAKTRTAFRFRNGRVVFVSPDLTAQDLYNRMSGRFPASGRRSFHEIAFDDGDGGAGWLYFGDRSPWSEFPYI